MDGYVIIKEVQSQSHERSIKIIYCHENITTLFSICRHRLTAGAHAEANSVLQPTWRGHGVQMATQPQGLREGLQQTQDIAVLRKVSSITMLCNVSNLFRQHSKLEAYNQGTRGITPTLTSGHFLKPMKKSVG